MSRKKHVFEMVPGQKFVCNPLRYENWLRFDDPQSMRKVKLIPLSEEDNDLELSIKFCSNIFLRGLRMYCIQEGRNGRVTKFAQTNEPGYYANSSAFVYDNDRLVKLSIETSTENKTVYYNIRAEELEYKYLTWEESGLGDDKYYFSDEEGNVIDSPDNQVLQYSMPHHDTERVIEDITQVKIPKSVLISNEFAKTFLKNLTGNQLEILADILSNEKLQILAKSLTNKQLQVLAENLTDKQFLALVNHLTDYQLQTLTHTLDPEKLRIIVPTLNKDQITNLVKDLNLDQVKEIFPHLKMNQFMEAIKTISDDQFVELIKDADEKALNTLLNETLKDRLPTLVKMLEGDKLHNLINKLDHEKLAIVARELTDDSDKIQMVVKSLANNPEKLKAFAHSMSHEQFKELLDNLGAEELKDIIHKLPHEKVISVIGDLSNQDQSKAIIDALKGKLEEQNEKLKEVYEKLEELLPPPVYSEALESLRSSPRISQDTNIEFIAVEEYAYHESEYL